MNEKELYKKVLDELFNGLKTDNHQKYKNDRLGERNFAIGELYPDIIMTSKDSNEVSFIIEIVTDTHLNIDTLNKKWKPFSELGLNFYLLVPKSKLKLIENWCNEEKMKVRFGTYEAKNNNEIELKFY